MQEEYKMLTFRNMDKRINAMRLDVAQLHRQFDEIFAVDENREFGVAAEKEHDNSLQRFYDRGGRP